MKSRIWRATLAWACFAAFAIPACPGDLTLHFPGKSGFSRQTVRYTCDAVGEDIGVPLGQFDVEYINGGGKAAMSPILQPAMFGQAASTSASPKYLILACDGGGMRGYLSSLILQRLNNDCGAFGESNRNIDLYAGTSTGGLIALGLAQGKSIDSIVDLYKHSGPDIFNPLGIQLGCIAGTNTAASTSQVDDRETLGASNGKELWQVLFDNLGSPSLLTVLRSFIPGNPLLSSPRFKGSRRYVPTWRCPSRSNFLETARNR